jgi:transposase-like protein
MTAVKASTTIRHRTGKVVLTNAYFRCTDCKRTRAGKHFGLRRMRNGVIRNQPQCSECRSKYH